MKTILCKMPDWMKHRLESRLPGEISITSEMQMSTMSTDENHEYHGSMLWLALTTRMNISIQSTPVKGRNPFTMHQITMYQIILYTPNISQFYSSIQFSSVQSLSHIWLSATLWTTARRASLSITNSQSWLKLMWTELVMPSNHLIPFCPCLQTFPASGIF